MSDWRSVHLGEIARIEIGGTPARDQPRFWAHSQEGHAWASIADLTRKWISTTSETITDAGVRHSNTKPIPPGTLMMSFKLTIGRCAIAARLLYSNEAIASFFLDRASADTHWLYYALPPIASRAVIDVAIKGGTLNMSSLRRLRVALPPLAEQNLIAQILDTIDSAVSRSEQIVAKLKLVKQGLVHDLLTRGIDDNGELRDPDRHPEQFQDSPLGRIPKTWVATQLGGVVPRATYGGSEALTAGPGIPVLRMNNIRDGEAHLEDLKYSDHPCYRGLLLRDGDVLFNRTNSIEHVGRTGIWRGQIATASFASYLVKLDPDPARLRCEFLNRLLNWDIIQLQIRRYATPGVHQVNINPTNLRRTLVALPTSLEEQDRITQLLAAEDGRIRAEVTVLEKLRLLKQALMDDLLTGRVRVTPLLEGNA
ncbi:type I restriction enzyme, S subunit [Nannocystis exedens]|uniref:Type I restriction enzyme, S subunit n=1 Tax=Nannocystis exedens TaxID=54 RepID=A0A1I1YME8_9BACT|nr:restriction endonuclease subunit S [Nannocystis exedens]PCC70354.1 Type-1 restriction enzyme EcoKI specificity protein [Nannocystis exedens]SFE19160.1 type I restriction enzyme, S subunit [Nannocystis exedens]